MTSSRDGTARAIRPSLSGLVAVLLGCGFSSCVGDGELDVIERAEYAAVSDQDCRDADSDGYGDGCELGRDCDDSDPETHACDDAEACATGETRNCRIELGTNGTVKSCVEGLQTCSGKQWGPCQSRKGL